MLLNFDIKNTLVIIVTALNLTTGFLTYIRNRNNTTNTFFFYFVVVISLWGLSMFLYRSSLDIALTSFFGRALYFWAALIPLFFIYFIYVFPKQTYSFKFWQKYLLPIPAIVVLFISAYPDLLIKTVYFVSGKEIQIVFNKPFYAFYIFYMVGYFNYAYFLLFKKYRETEKGPLRFQMGNIIVGTLLTTLIGTVTNLLGPYFDYFELNWVGQVGLIAMIAAIAYSIFKYQLFNIKLILVEIALIVLNFLLFANAVLSKEGDILLLNSALFISVLVLSIFLIRGIYKDIRDRERIQILAKDMAAANKRLFALEQQKTEFVSIASHQLRTPMTVIKGYASMVLEGAFGALPPDAKEAMGKLYKSSERIVALIEDLLTVSRIEQGRGMPVFETINFADFVRELLVPVTIDIREAGLRVSFSVTEGSTETKVPLDKKKFEQAFRHLIDNAIKYTKAPGAISINLSSDQTQHRVYLSISDTGAGMTKEQIKALSMKSAAEEASREGSFGFSVKERQKALAEAEGALQKKHTGIGLYIAQEIINAHYGQIHVESEGRGKGTTIIVELPELE